MILTHEEFIVAGVYYLRDLVLKHPDIEEWKIEFRVEDLDERYEHYLEDPEGFVERMSEPKKDGRLRSGPYFKEMEHKKKLNAIKQASNL